MSLINCLDCGQEISDQAEICVSCGRPMGDNAESPGKKNILWSVVGKARTPINVFALAMMACASVLGASATQISNCFSQTAFTYTIHAFIAVSGMFFLSILFCRKGIYHPEDLSKIKPEVLKDLGKDRPVVAAVLIALMMAAYGYYQFSITRPCGPDTLQHSQSIQQDASQAGASE